MKKHRFTTSYYLICLLSIVLLGTGQTVAQVSESVRDSIVDLDEVMVVGYATSSLSKTSGAIDRINEEGMNKSLIVSPLDAIRGRIAGVNITPANNGPAVVSSVRIRGTTSLTGVTTL